MNRREMIQTTALGVAGFGVGTAFTAPACPSKPTKEKAVKYAGLIIDLSTEAVPLLNLLGASDIAAIIESKVIPALEKLKDSLGNVDIPGSRSTLETVRNGITGAITALGKLPESRRRTTIIGVLVTVRVFLLTIEAFVDSEMTPVTPQTAMKSPARTVTAESINRVLEATKP